MDDAELDKYWAEIKALPQKELLVRIRGYRDACGELGTHTWKCQQLEDDCICDANEATSELLDLWDELDDRVCAGTIDLQAWARERVHR